ncbi:MAG: ABC transporter ATP-binding protein [Methylobacteriaceae bacterium]|nr:ABC transporter ATP-binding protein [Methylobacteriaceae bacterium]
MTLLFEDVTKRFGALVAIDKVSIAFEPGLIYSIIGPNGAGKSTLINMCAGSYRVSEGRIRLDGVELQALEKYQIAQHGIARTYQNIRLFDGMTVLQNLEVCLFPELFGRTLAEVFLPGAARRMKDERTERCLLVLARFGLAALADEMAADLSYGNQKLLEIARATVLAPKVLMLDEPAAGLNHGETDRLKEKLRELARPDLTMIIVEHDMSLVMALSDHIVVLHQGRLLFEGTPAEVQANLAVQEAYLGSPGEVDGIREAARSRANRVRIRADADIERRRPAAL